MTQMPYQCSKNVKKNNNKKKNKNNPEPAGSIRATSLTHMVHILLRWISLIEWEAEEKSALAIT